MHWLDWVQAPIRVPAARSKISIAFPVPVTLALAVAVSVAFCPGWTLPESAASWTRIVGPATSSDETGTLGATTGVRATGPWTWAGASRTTSVHAAGLGRAGVPGATGQAVCPSGIEATPGAGKAPVAAAHA